MEMEKILFKSNRIKISKIELRKTNKACQWNWRANKIIIQKRETLKMLVKLRKTQAMIRSLKSPNNI
jgi:hypothetical protein